MRRTILHADLNSFYTSVLNLATVAVVQHYTHKPTVYEVKYTFSDRGSLERFDRLVSD